MYWYNSVKKSILRISVLLLLGSGYACNKPEIKETGAELKYFDIKGYFKQEASRLVKLDPEVTKSVSHNGTSESKKVHVKAWQQELNLFAESDINKPAWRNSYTVKNNADSTVYIANDPALKTREIVIKKQGDKVTAVSIFNNIRNFLYNTSERLVYLPGQYYLIDKKQQVKVMGANDYRVKGSF